MELVKEKKVTKAEIMGMSILIFIMIAEIVYFIGMGIPFPKNIRNLERALSTYDYGRGGKETCLAEHIRFDYDYLYSFGVNESKEDMEKEIGFACSILEPSVADDDMNIVFIKDNKPICYLNSQHQGYYINIPKGKYTKEQIDTIKFEVKVMADIDSSGNKKRCYHYLYQN